AGPKIAFFMLVSRSWAPRPRPLSVRVPAFWRLACMLAEGRNGWAPSGYRKKTRTGINQQVPHAHSSRAVARRGARSGPGLWWACVGAEGDLGGLGPAVGTVSRRRRSGAMRAHRALRAACDPDRPRDERPGRRGCRPG